MANETKERWQEFLSWAARRHGEAMRAECERILAARPTEDLAELGVFCEARYALNKTELEAAAAMEEYRFSSDG